MILKTLQRRIGASVNDHERVFGLDLMRAVAIAMVLLAHCSWIAGENNGIVSQVLALFGFLGVEVFFVLSGFLIGRILYRNYLEGFSRDSAMRFLRRRWFRTLPNYFLVLMLNILIAVFIGYDISYVWRYFIFMQNFAWPLLPFFPESWSLAVEEFAYVLLPLILLLVGGLSMRPKVSFMITVISLIVLCLLSKVGYHMQNGLTPLSHWNIALKSVVIFRLDAILTGVVFAWISVESKKFWQNAVPVMTVFGVIMIMFFTAGVGFLRLTIDRFPFFWNVLYLPLASLSIALFLPLLSTWKNRPAFWRPVVFLSVISYSVYLLHYSIVLQSMKQFFNTEAHSPGWQIGFAVAYIAVTLLLSAFLFAFFEKPMTDLRDRSTPGTAK